MKHEYFQWTMDKCLSRMLILIKRLRSVCTDRCGLIERGLVRSTARLRRFRRIVDNLRCRNGLLVVEATRTAERAELTERIHGAIDA
jgi:hypothetical protein